MSIGMKQTQNMVGSGENERSTLDFYETPPEATRALMELETFDSGIWEPACGAGAISKVLATKYPVLSTDISHYGYEYQTTQMDFLKVMHSQAALHTPSYPHIVTNPPFKQSMDFALGGIDYCRVAEGKLVLLNRLQWLEGITRKEKLFDKYPPSRVWVFSRRIPRMHNPTWEGKKTTSLVAFAWYVWDFVDMNYNGETRLGWVDWKKEAK